MIFLKNNYKFLYDICCEYVDITDFKGSIDGQVIGDSYSDVYR